MSKIDSKCFFCRNSKNFVLGNKIVFAELPHLPGVLIIYRSPDERKKSPERLNKKMKI